MSRRRASDEETSKLTNFVDEDDKKLKEMTTDFGKEKNEEDFCIWDEAGEWFIGTVRSNFRRVTTKFGEKFVVNIDIAEGKEHAVWLDVNGKVKGGTKNADFLEALDFNFKDKEKFNPLSLQIRGKEILCLWGTFLVKNEAKVGVIRFRKI